MRAVRAMAREADRHALRTRGAEAEAERRPLLRSAACERGRERKIECAARGDLKEAAEQCGIGQAGQLRRDQYPAPAYAAAEQAVEPARSAQRQSAPLAAR